MTENIGQKIRDIRTSIGLTQEELAERADLTKGFISQVENNLTSLSVESLLLILNAMDVAPSVFFSDAKKQVVFTENDYIDGYRDEVKEWKILIPGSMNHEMEPVLVTLAPGEQTEMEKEHFGEEFGFVLKGTVILHLGENTYKVRSGQSFFYSAHKHHFLKNEGRYEASVLWVSSPPSF